MINEERTFAEFGYISNELSYWSSKKVWVICNNCKKERLLQFRFHSNLCRSCANIGKNNPMYGKHLLKEHKMKISKSNIGKKQTEETKQKISKANSGKHPSEEIRKKMSKAHRGKKNSEECKLKMSKSRRGKNNPRWNPDLTKEDREIGRKYPEYYMWRKAVFERDNYTCQICGERGYILNAHHLKSYANNKELRVIILNGITLCKKCHSNFHHKYGYNNIEEQYIEFKENYKLEGEI